MPDRPYTDDDLRAEAARQHASLISDLEFMGVGERMEDAWVPSVETPETGSARTWGELLDPEQDGCEAYDLAQNQIHDLIRGAADLSAWAVQLGAEELAPAEYRLVDGEGTEPFAAFHVALDPHIELDPRAYPEIADVIRRHAAFREDT